MVVLLRISSLAVAAMMYTCVSVSAFIVPSPSWSIRMVPTTATGGNYNNKYVIGALLSSNEDENESMSFSDAEQAIREEEEEKRMQQRGDDSEEVRRDTLAAGTVFTFVEEMEMYCLISWILVFVLYLCLNNDNNNGESRISVSLMRIRVRMRI